MYLQQYAPEPDSLESQDLWVNFGPQHPSMHGVMRLLVRLEGEVVREVVPIIGYLHRALEKIAESRTFPQFIPYTDREDYLGAMNGNLGYVLAVERLLEVEVPRRAALLRVLVAELNRIASHLIWWGTYSLDLGGWTGVTYGFREREGIVDIFQDLCGARLTYSYLRFGGVSRDIRPETIQKIKDFIPFLRKMLGEYRTLLTGNVIFEARTQGIGVISKEEAVNWGLTGPNVRASGVDYDLRRDDPYCLYPEFEFDVPVAVEGDCYARYLCRFEEMYQSLRIVEQVLAKLEPGPIQGKVPRVIKPKAGEVYLRTEAPRGELGVLLVADGSPTPWRLKLRGPSFNAVGAIPRLAQGWKIGDLISIIGSIDIILPDVDR
ncbi:MAG: NADH-quinone oxidoreductase subunit D [Myxococcota bacterium]|jgi:NADH-quinone oxidoreductase subunit D|nr:NADH-quinone oxidoreductase subunit D [Myxococcota bacterium]